MPDVRQATATLSEAVSDSRTIICIHYACEDFTEVLDRPAVVTAIGVAVSKDSSGEHDANVFSIANSKEDQNPQAREKEMLERFFAFAKAQPDALWVHWNMNNATYGFNALISRYRFLFEEDPPVTFRPDRLFDLDSIVAARYGDVFAPHPKLENLCRMNKMFMTMFSTGREEAAAFAEGNFGLCERSAGHKAHLIGSILSKFLAGNLLTANSVGVVKFADQLVDAVNLVVRLGERFLYVERALRKRHANRPTIDITDEYDAQDLLGALLRIFFEDVRPEEHIPSYAGASSRVDFVLPEVRLAVELKYARDSMTSKTLGEELIVDRARYESHSGVSHLVCLVFDHAGRLDNPRGLERDLTRDSSLNDFPVTVLILDR